MNNQIMEIVNRHNNDPDNLIPILQEIQGKEGYLSQEAISEVTNVLNISESKIYGVATFYTQFKFIKPGLHQIRICQGTACHVRGSDILLDLFKSNLGIGTGETTTDDKFSLERVACLGCCALAPVMVIDNEVYGHLTTTKAEAIISKYKEEKS